MIFSRNAPEIAAIFGFLTGAIFFRTVYTIVSRYFYAQKDTWTPLIDTLLAFVLFVYLVSIFSKPSSYGITGIALAEAIVAGFQLFILTTIMVMRDHKLFDKKFIAGLGKIVSVTGFTVLAAYIMVSLFPLGSTDTGFITLTAKMSLIAGVTFSVYLFFSSLFGLEETVPVFRKAHAVWRTILRPIKVEL